VSTFTFVCRIIGHLLRIGTDEREEIRDASMFTFVSWIVGGLLFAGGLLALLLLPGDIPTWRTVVYVAMVILGVVLVPWRGQWWKTQRRDK
jgi:hypothetical protein